MRIAGKDLPKEKNIDIALSYIFGIGRALALRILKKLEINPLTKTKNLSEEEQSKIREEIEKNYKIESDLRLEIDRNLRRLKDTRSYRGMRHLKGLPSRGQQTRTNARTRKGKRVTVGSGHIRAPSPK